MDGKRSITVTLIAAIAVIALIFYYMLVSVKKSSNDNTVADRIVSIEEADAVIVRTNDGYEPIMSVGLSMSPVAGGAPRLITI